MLDVQVQGRHDPKKGQKLHRKGEEEEEEEIVLGKKVR